ncbi:beta strand repeat-containing protein [Konateibacter massiliensis]|uniref:beta strand repeat-containing protein n=1 Tax=Konateibacter massiliensis TaxID=2002841 RepID=UPI000C156521|nr:adhesin [Konateibacter massiliensis]
MYKKKLKRTMACIMAASLVVSTFSATSIVKAASANSNTAEEGQQPPSGDMPGGEAPDGNPPGDPPSGGMGGANTMTYDYSGTLSGALTADGTSVTSDGETTTASTAEQNAALVQNGGTLTITNGTLQKSGDSENADNCNFYGVNAILLAINSGSMAYISDTALTADSEGSNAIFATDSATVYANNNTISTTSNSSRGLDATYSGTIIANDMTISTKGDHSATIATDRGGGTISATNSTLSTEGSGSPLLYSTGDIQVNNITGTASGSQIAGMEGYNTILIHNSNLTSTITDKTASDPIANGIIIYQSTSGDAESTTGSTATFEAADSTLTSAITSGAMFYLTNTEANIVLSNTVLDFDSDNVNLLTIQGNDSNSWGTAGSNGAQAKFTAIGETLSGDIDVDTISILDLYLLEGTTYTGAATISTNEVNTSQTDSPITINLDSTSKWIVTADTTISNLNAESGAAIVDESGKTVTIVANGETIVGGTSEYTITVTGAYSDSITTDSTNQLSTDYIDRSDFDAYYNVSTAFGSSTTTDSTTVSEAEDTSVEGDTENASDIEDEVVSEEIDTAEATESNVMQYAIIAVAVCAVIGGGFVFYKKKR